MKSIYLDHAATTPIAKAALDAMKEAYAETWGNPSSLHSCGRVAAERLARARETIASCVGAEPEEVIFTSGGSESDTQALLTMARFGSESGKRHLVSDPIEHEAVAKGLEKLATEGFSVTYADVSRNGVIAPEAVGAAICGDTCGVSIMSANNETGVIQPIEEISALCAERGVLFHTDAVQTVGHLKTAFSASGISLLSASAHKFGGPRGVGFLLAKRGLVPNRLVLGGMQEHGVRAGTENLPAILGMAAALSEWEREREHRQKRVALLRKRLLSGLCAIPGVHLTGSDAEHLPGHVHVCLEDIDGEALLWRLDDRDICVSTGSACHSLSGGEENRVLRAMGIPNDLARGALRMTISHENTEEEIDLASEALRLAVEELRRLGALC